MDKRILTSQRTIAAAPEPRSRTRVWFVWALGVLVIAAGVIGFLRRPEFQIADISVMGTQTLDPQAIQNVAAQRIQGNVAFLIPKSNALFFSKTNTEHAIMQAFSGLKSVTASFPARNRLVITVTEKNPEYVWCRETCWFVDQDGVMYDQAPQFSDGVYIQFRGVAIGLTVPENPSRSRFAPAPSFARMKQTIATLAAYPIDVAGVTYFTGETVFDAQPTGPGDVGIRVTQMGDYPVNPNTLVLITDAMTTDQVGSALDLLMREGKFSDLLKSKGGALQYVDLRFDGKIYYKFAQ